MKIICISDTHSKHRELELPEGDMLIHAGDLTRKGKEEEFIDFNEWLEELDFQHKICIAGNHDRLLDRQPEKAKELLTNCTYLNDEWIQIEGIKIWGSPITPWFLGMAFNRKRGRKIRKHWDQIPTDIDILVTHGPPKRMLDRTNLGLLAGCQDLANTVEEIKPKLHVFGHIHEQAGEFKTPDTWYVNAVSVNLKYQPIHPPIVIDWDLISIR